MSGLCSAAQLLPPDRPVIRLNINAELREIVQRRSYLICKGGGLGTEFRKKRVTLLALVVIRSFFKVLFICHK